MLYLTRKIGESVVINDEIEVTVVEVKGKSAKLGITFPEQATVLRREVYDRIQAENAAAAAANAEALSEALAADTSPLGSQPTAGRDDPPGDGGGESGGR
jgi:carbon storage regulator